MFHMMLSRKGLFAFFMLPVAIALPAFSAELTVDVQNLRSGGGNVHFAIYAAPESFPSSKGMLKDQIIPVNDKSAAAVFSGLAPGVYALAVFHDENANHEFDKGFLDIPLEGYGFSNDAKVFFGPPDFADAAVEVVENGSKISISMVYITD